MSKKIQITFSDELLLLVDKFAKFNGIARSAAVSVLCSQALSQSNAMQTMSELMQAYNEEKEKKALLDKPSEPGK